jgi:hypothetical protein
VIKPQKLSYFEVESSRQSWFCEKEEESRDMAKKGHSEEEILRVLRAAEAHDGGGGLPKVRHHATL